MNHPSPTLIGYLTRNVLLTLVLAAIAVSISFFAFPQIVYPQTADELRNQVDVLQKQVDLYQKAIDQKESESNTLKNKLDILKKDIQKKELQIKQTTLTIQRLTIEVAQKEQSLKDTGLKIELSKNILINYLRQLNELDKKDDMYIVLSSAKLSDYFDNLKAVENIQEKADTLLASFKDLRDKLAQEKSDLEDQQTEALNLKGLSEIEKKSLNDEKKQNDNLLKVTKGQEAEYQKILKTKKQDLATLKSQLFYLEQTGITVEDALKYAQLAADRAGIRTAFLLALLEVETGRQFQNGTITVGTNLGSGNWKTDMYDCYIKLGKRSTAEAQKAAYFKITDELNYDPDKMPVSRKPSYGCGGAIGPAQFLPATWLLYEDRVAQLTGKNPPDPWKVETSFTAAARYLADRGADKQTTATERAAAKAYISGSPTCSSYTCNLYSSNIISLTKVIADAI